MKIKDPRYKKILILLFHVSLGVLLYYAQFLSLLYLLGFFSFFLYQIIRHPNSRFWVLAGSAYITGAEIFLRMTNGMVFYETGKYMVILFMLIGVYQRGFKLKAWPYLLYIALLLPGVYVSYLYMNFVDISFRKTILFNLSGPLSLFFSALYCFQLKIKLKDFLKVLDYLVYPLIAMTIYVVVYTPETENVFAAAESNAAASGGWSGNQVATIFGLGIFALFVRFLIPYKNRLLHFIMMGALALMAYRAFLTFSRGGVFTAALMCLIFGFIFYFKISLWGKTKLITKALILVFGVVALWSYSIVRTDGMIVNRYEGRSSQGELEDDITTGRIDILAQEIDAFLEAPFTGIGVGGTKFYRAEKTGIDLPSHNEVTRMLGEHGFFGILALLILLFTPLFLLFSGHKNIFLIPFIAFWGLTINHSAMRVAAPGFIYGLALLNVTYQSKRSKAKKNKIDAKKNTALSR